MPHLSEPLLQSILEGVLETPPWDGFVRRLRREFGGSLANLTFRRPGAALSYYVSDSAAHLRHRYYREFQDQDPIDYFGMERGRAYLLEEFLSGGKGAAFLAEFLKPSGVHHMMICRTDEPGGYRAWLSVCRDEAGPPFSEACRARFEQVARLMGGSLRVFAALKGAEFNLEIHSRATRALALGTIVLDQTGRVLSIDAEAQWKLSGQTAIRVREGRLRLESRALDKELQRNLDGLLKEGIGSRSLTMSVGGAAQLELLLCAASEAIDCISTAAPGVTVYLRSDSSSAMLDAGPIAELFHLSHREAELASLLAKGRTLAEAAVDLNVTEATVRTYSKRIFEKTGVRRQTELVRRILTSVAPLAGHLRH